MPPQPIWLDMVPVKMRAEKNLVDGQLNQFGAVCVYLCEHTHARICMDI